MPSVFNLLFTAGTKLSDRQVVCGLLVALVGYVVYAHEGAMSRLDRQTGLQQQTAEAVKSSDAKLDKVIERHDHMQQLLLDRILRQERKADAIERDQAKIKARVGLDEPEPAPQPRAGPGGY